MTDTKDFAVLDGHYTKCTYYDANSKPIRPKDPDGPACENKQPKGVGICQFFFNGDMCTYFNPKEAKK